MYVNLIGKSKINIICKHYLINLSFISSYPQYLSGKIILWKAADLLRKLGGGLLKRLQLNECTMGMKAGNGEVQIQRQISRLSKAFNHGAPCEKMSVLIIIFNLEKNKGWGGE